MSRIHGTPGTDLFLIHGWAPCYMTSMARPNPFPLTLDPRYFYRPDSINETIAKARYVIDNRFGLMALYGEVGMGKSLVLRSLYGEYAARPDAEAALIPKPNFDTGLALLRAICVELGVPRRRSLFDQWNEAQSALVDILAGGKNCVVFIDEAQTMNRKTLEMLRDLLNFETPTTKLLTIVICGQIELRDRLKDKANRALASRVFTTSTLDPLTRVDTGAMIAYRCEQASEPNRFTDDAIERVYQRTKGVPRDVVRVCGMAWGYADMAGIDTVPIEAVDQAADEAHIGEDHDQEVLDSAEASRAESA